MLLFVRLAHCIEIKGIDDVNITSLIKDQITITNSDIKDFADSISIKHKIKENKRLIKTILKSLGYFDCQIKYKFKNNKLYFYIDLNERYKLNNIILKYDDNPSYFSGITVKKVFELINIDYDSYTTTKEIFEASTKIKEFLQSKGFAFVSTSAPKLKTDEKNKKITAIYHITLNRKIKINKTKINIKSEQHSSTLLQFVKNRILWEDGEIYDIKKVNDTKDILMESGIFSGIEVNLSDPKKDPTNEEISLVDLNVNVEEALPRDISAGLKYGSSEKLGLLLSWTHYNIDGKGSKLMTLIDVAKKNRTAKIKFDYYDVFYKMQRLSSQVFYTKEDANSYDVSKNGIEAILWQRFSEHFDAGIGGVLEDAKTKDKVMPSDTREKFNGFGIPIGLKLDNTDSFLDPERGIRVSGIVTPYFGNTKNLTTMSGKTSFYLPFAKNDFNKPLVMAFHAKAGSIIRDEKSSIPRDRLFFRGGADSVRGYGYQKLGPVNDNKKAFGGRSFVEFGVEPRLKIKEDLGIVFFFEGGNVFSSRLPHIMKKMLFGYGIGVRYYTQLGPIRLDIAMPTKIRKNSAGKKIDSLFNVYLSIGQAF